MLRIGNLLSHQLMVNKYTVITNRKLGIEDGVILLEGKARVLLGPACPATVVLLTLIVIKI